MTPDAASPFCVFVDVCLRGIAEADEEELSDVLRATLGAAGCRQHLGCQEKRESTGHVLAALYNGDVSAFCTDLAASSQIRRDSMVSWVNRALAVHFTGRGQQPRWSNRVKAELARELAVQLMHAASCMGLVLGAQLTDDE